MTDTYVRVEERDKVLCVTLDRPQKRNAYDGAGLKAVAAAFTALDDGAHLRVGLLSGAGEHFCSGADIAAAASGGFDEPPYPRVAHGLARKPVIVAIEGMCLGGGLMIATGADLRVASTNSRYGLPEARWNLPSPWLGALARQIRPSDVTHLALRADHRFSAEHMLGIGFLHEVVADGHAFDAGMALAQRLAHLAPASLMASKELIAASQDMDLATAAELGERQGQRLARMQDTVEGGQAFAQGRQPKFEGQ